MISYFIEKNQYGGIFNFGQLNRPIVDYCAVRYPLPVLLSMNGHGKLRDATI